MTSKRTPTPPPALSAEERENLRREMEKHMRIQARKQGQERLEQAAEAFERAAKEMRRYAEQYANVREDNDRMNILNFALHYAAQSPGSSLRLDLLANSQAALAVFDHLERTEGAQA